MSVEIWKEVAGYGGHYEVSSYGRVRSKDRIVRKKCTGIGQGVCEQKYKGKLLRTSTASSLGHKSVHIGVDGEKYTVSVHRLVLTTFVGPQPHGMEGCHNNGVASDNRLENLRWDTHLENNKDRKRHGMYAIGEQHPMSRLTNEIVLEIRNSGLNGPQVAKKYGIGTSTAHRIITGRSWTHVAL